MGVGSGVGLEQGGKNRKEQKRNVLKRNPEPAGLDFFRGDPCAFFFCTISSSSVSIGYGPRGLGTSSKGSKKEDESFFFFPNLAGKLRQFTLNALENLFFFFY